MFHHTNASLLNKSVKKILLTPKFWKVVYYYGPFPIFHCCELTILVRLVSFLLLLLFYFEVIVLIFFIQSDSFIHKLQFFSLIMSRINQWQTFFLIWTLNVFFTFQKSIKINTCLNCIAEKYETNNIDNTVLVLWSCVWLYCCLPDFRVSSKPETVRVYPLSALSPPALLPLSSCSQQCLVSALSSPQAVPLRTVVQAQDPGEREEGTVINRHACSFYRRTYGTITAVWVIFSWGIQMKCMNHDTIFHMKLTIILINK